MAKAPLHSQFSLMSFTSAAVRLVDVVTATTHLGSDHFDNELSDDSDLEFVDVSAMVSKLESEDHEGMAEARKWVGQELFSTKTESLRALRLSRGLSQAEFARLMGSGQGVISRWENGRVDMRTSTICRIAAVLDVDADLVWKAVCSGCDEGESGNV